MKGKFDYSAFSTAARTGGDWAAIGGFQWLGMRRGPPQAPKQVTELPRRPRTR